MVAVATIKTDRSRNGRPAMELMSNFVYFCIASMANFGHFLPGLKIVKMRIFFISSINTYTSV